MSQLPAHATDVSVCHVFHARSRRIKFSEGGSNRRSLFDAVMPARQRTARCGTHSVVSGAVHHRGGRRIGPSELVASEPGLATEPFCQPSLDGPRLLERLRSQPIGKRAGRAPEPEHLAETPVDCLVLRIADILSDPSECSSARV